MREIKFRIWDVENKEMLKVQELDFEPTFYGGRIAIRPYQYNDYFDTEDMILMQYTGLKDKNGKEIYEGDIVEIIVIKQFAQKEDDHEKVKGIIVFEQGEFLVKNSNSAFGPAYYHLRLCKEIEKIGNIWEDSDLLDDRKNKRTN